MMISGVINFMSDENNILKFGYIHAYDPFKGFGFIRRESGKDVFFHHSSLDSEEHGITIGDNVQFFIEETSKGLQAYKVCRSS